MWPYKILEHYFNVSYHVELPAQLSYVHPTLHISLRKKNLKNWRTEEKYADVREYPPVHECHHISLHVGQSGVPRVSMWEAFVFVGFTLQSAEFLVLVHCIAGMYSYVILLCAIGTCNGFILFLLIFANDQMWIIAVMFPNILYNLEISNINMQEIFTLTCSTS